jgi:hypothetical protein
MASNIPQPALRTEPNRSLTLLGLPAELRLHIYEFLLPQAIKDSETLEWPTNGLRLDGEKCATSFLATCEQVHQEAVGLLYPNKPILVTVHGHDAELQEAGISIFGREYLTLGEVLGTNIFEALRNINGMVVRVTTSVKPCSVVEIQDLLSALTKSLEGRIGTLHSLHLDLQISYVPGQMPIANPTDPKDLRLEFRRIQPGSITRSRGHVAAFLTDPLMQLRGIQSLTMDYPGHALPPWQDVYFRVHRATTSIDSTKTRDFNPFGPYYAKLSLLQATLPDGLPNRILEPLARARIQGDVAAFREAHYDLIRSVWALLEASSRGAPIQQNEGIRARFERAYEVFTELPAWIPDVGVDPNALGYNVMDGKLKEWRAGADERRAEKEGKKRKKMVGSDAKARTAKKPRK